MPMSRKDRFMAAEKRDTFFNLYNHGFVRAAVCIPEVKVADVFFNTQKTIELAWKAARQKNDAGHLPGAGNFRLFQ